MNKSGSSPRLIAAPMPDWLLKTAHQIRVIDYELHAAIRIITKGEMQPEHIPAFVEACQERDRLMAMILSHLADQCKPSSYHEQNDKTRNASRSSQARE
jgi:hypothetical protein